MPIPMQTQGEASDIDALVMLCDRAFKNAGARRLACVREDAGSIDLLYLDSAGARIVVRCVQRPRPRDLNALQTMLHEGPLDRAILLHGAGADEPTPVEVWSQSQLSRLAETLRPQ